jgi:hypothetical protein
LPGCPACRFTGFKVNLLTDPREKLPNFIGCLTLRLVLNYGSTTPKARDEGDPLVNHDWG